MAKRVFFSFHYQDVIDFRANAVRNCWLTHKDRESAGFFDASIWEKAKTVGVSEIKKLINTNLENTSVTAVLIGEHTYSRRWVRYEICKSLARGNKLIGIHINQIKCKNGKTKYHGPDPFEYLAVTISSCGSKVTGFLEYDPESGQWVNYKDLEEGYSLGERISHDYCGKSWKLSEFFKPKCWVGDDGYNQFAIWVG